MVDAHVHLEKGKYCVEWIQEFIRYALVRDIDEIYFLEHTHIFKECQSLYDEMSHYKAYQNQWYRKKGTYPFDFFVGSIHFIDGWAFSHMKQPWKKEDYDLNSLYQRYYNLMRTLVKSKLFTGLAHPNSLQCFGAYPVNNYDVEYNELEAALKENHMYIEESSGLAINYCDSRLGMNKEMLKTMQKNDVWILTASDAHVPQNVGRLIREMEELLAD